MVLRAEADRATPGLEVFHTHKRLRCRGTAMQQQPMFMERGGSAMSNRRHPRCCIAGMLLLASFIAIADDGAKKSTTNLLVEIETSKARDVLAYGQESYAYTSYFAVRDRIVQLNADALVQDGDELSVRDDLVSISLFDGDEIRFQTEEFRKIADGIWAWKVRQILSAEFEDHLGSVADMNDLGIPGPEFVRALTSSVFYVNSWDVHEPTGEVTYAGEKLAANVAPTPNPDRRAGIYRANAFYSIEGTFTNLLTTKLYAVASFPETPKYLLLFERDSSPGKQFPTDSDPLGTASDLRNQRAYEQQRRLDAYDAYAKHMIGEGMGEKTAREEP